jgi:hypothetical protein
MSNESKPDVRWPSGDFGPVMSNSYTADQMRAAVAAERERCAKLADEYATWGGSNFHDMFKTLADDIRTPTDGEQA